MAKATSPLPAALAKAARRFDSWRRSRTTRRIPEELWSLAAELGARYGVSRTSRALRVGYYDLEKRIASSSRGRRDLAEETPAFVEILTAPSSALPLECIVEFERAAGDRMRIEMKGARTSDLAELSRLFLEPRR
jgi:hypothetical protein